MSGDKIAAAVEAMIRSDAVFQYEQHRAEYKYVDGTPHLDAGPQAMTLDDWCARWAVIAYGFEDRAKLARMAQAVLELV